ncbi:hypothetical protein CXB51_010662 [Gossypium anomalum]|uniref:Uncharacterized protein n=1 Tax=Gossypium anomalum TaxID=47600 RepID=A0A8J5Z7D7_9ROSI|nr:hypothetical protein CXB51_010662 [Gossypium anomalum]
MDLFYFTIYQDQESNPSNKKGSHFDWMGLNEEILSHPIPNLELWFFPEFVLLYNAYKVKPWIIPIKLLLFGYLMPWRGLLLFRLLYMLPLW